MELKKTLYSSQTYNVLKASAYAFPIYLLATIILIVIFKALSLPGLGVMSWVLISTVPFIFQKDFKNIFTQNTKLTFDDQCLMVQQYHLKSNKSIKEFIVDWADVTAFKCTLSSNTIYITIYLRNELINKFSLKEEKTYEQITNG